MAKTGQKSVKVEVKNVILDVSANVEDLVVELEKNLRGAIGCVYVKADKMEKILKEHHEMEAQIVALEAENSRLKTENAATDQIANEYRSKCEILDSELRAVKNALNPPEKPTDAQISDYVEDKMENPVI
jgi:chromosome segregation ATPase